LIIEDERLKNPAEVIEALLRRFKMQMTAFDDDMNGSKDVGMLKVNIEAVKESLPPSAKAHLETMKVLLPKIVAERGAALETWLKG
jgi:hypothetical protein